MTIAPDHADPHNEDAAAPRPAWKQAVDIGLWILIIGMLVWRFGPQVGAAIGLGDTDLPAPDFVVTTFEGDTLRLSELRGQVILLNFWATWCLPCRAEMPGFEDVWEDYRHRGFTLVGLSVDRGDRDAVEHWVRQRGFTYPMAFAPGSLVRAYGGANVLPTSVLINRDGRIVQRVEGFYAEPALRAALNRLLD